jgi:hypothetical protein
MPHGTVVDVIHSCGNLFEVDYKKKVAMFVDINSLPFGVSYNNREL